MRIICVANQKGGVGKTCVTHNIAGALARAGKNVLCIDADPQGSLTNCYGYNTDGKNTLYEVLKEMCDINEAIVNINDRVDLIAADLVLDQSETELANEIARDCILSDCLKDLDKEYDYILIDSRPSLGFLTTNAMVAASEVFIVMKPEFLSGQATTTLMKRIEVIQKRLNPELKVSGVIINMYDARRTDHNTAVKNIREYFKDKVFDSIIKTNAGLGSAPGLHQDIFSFAESNKTSSAKTAMETMLNLGTEIIKQEAE